MKSDEEILLFLDDDHCLAYIRKAKLEGYAEMIKKNPENANLVKASAFLRDLKVGQS